MDNAFIRECQAERQAQEEARARHSDERKRAYGEELGMVLRAIGFDSAPEMNLWISDGVQFWLDDPIRYPTPASLLKRGDGKVSGTLIVGHTDNHAEDAVSVPFSFVHPARPGDTGIRAFAANVADAIDDVNQMRAAIESYAAATEQARAPYRRPIERYEEALLDALYEFVRRRTEQYDGGF